MKNDRNHGLTPNLRSVLKAIGMDSGAWNWKTLREHCQREGGIPAEFDMKPLFKLGYVVERFSKDNNQHRLFITELGEKALEATQ